MQTLGAMTVQTQFNSHGQNATCHDDEKIQLQNKRDQTAFAYGLLSEGTKTTDLSKLQVAQTECMV